MASKAVVKDRAGHLVAGKLSPLAETADAEPAAAMKDDFDPPFGGQEEANMTTQTQDPSAPPNGVQASKAGGLVAYRDAPKKGMPTEGLGLVVGHPKSGKSKLVADFPGAYIMELERAGGDRLPGRFHDIRELGNRESPTPGTFRAVMPAVLANPSVKVVVIDTIDELALWVGAEIAQGKGLASMNDRKQGVDGFALWGEFKDRLEGFTKAMKECGKLVLFVAHCKPPEKDDQGKVITPAGINISGKAASYMAAQAEFICYCYKQELGSGTQYNATFRGGPLALWGSRVKELNDKTFVLPDNNPYAALAAAFKEPVNDAPKATITKKGKIEGGK